MTPDLGTAAVPPSVAVPTVLRVRGVLLGRFDLVDGRPADDRSMIADQLAAFEPDTVPILTAHGGDRLGWLSTLEAWDELGLDLAFRGSITTTDADLVARLWRGVHASAEISPPRDWPRVGPGWATRPAAYFRGTRSPSWQLVGVAIVSNPAARGSWMAAEP
jgi:hypothetical protein